MGDDRFFPTSTKNVRHRDCAFASNLSAEITRAVAGKTIRQINLGFTKPVENIGSLRFSSIVHERYLLEVARTNRLAEQAEIAIDALRLEKIIAFNRKNLSYVERYFNEKFEE